MRRHVLALIATLALSTTFAREAFAVGTELQRPPEGKGVFIVALRTDAASIKVAAPDFAALGGEVLRERLSRRLVILPLETAETLRGHARVEWVQRVWIDEEPQPATAEASLPERSVEAQARWTSGDDGAEAPDWTTGEFVYDGSGNIASAGTDQYRYDSAGRLIQAAVGSAAETYGYDAFGNRIGPNAPAAPATNRLNGHTYDAVGNLLGPTATPSRYRYDATGMMAGMVPQTGRTQRMLYTADDERLAVVDKEGTDVVTQLRVRDFGGKVLREWSIRSSGTEWVRDYIYENGRLIAGERQAAEGETGTRHFHLDHIGSVRFITRGGDGVRITAPRFMPFGAEEPKTIDEYTNLGFNPLEPMKFTGHERDYTGTIDGADLEYIDYMHARYYDSRVGRFLSVDPHLGRPEVPQSWNRYTYTLNNPVRFVDPTGRDCTTTEPGAVAPLVCTDEITVRETAPRPTLAQIAFGVLGEALDMTAEQLLQPTVGNLSEGLLQDDPAKLALGVASVVATAAPGGALAGATRTLGAGGSTMVVNLGGIGEVGLGSSVVNVQAATIAGDTGLAFQNAVSVARTSGQRVIMAHGDALPFRTGAVRTVVTNNVPVDAGVGYFGRSFTSREVLRILQRPFGQWWMTP